MCTTAIFRAELEGKKTRMLAVVVPRELLPYPAIVGRNGSGLHLQWNVRVLDENTERGEPSSQVLDENATVGEAGPQVKDESVLQDVPSGSVDLDTITPAQVLAVQTRAQRK